LPAHLFKSCGHYTYWEELEVNVSLSSGVAVMSAGETDRGRTVMYVGVVYYTNV